MKTLIVAMLLSVSLSAMASAPAPVPVPAPVAVASEPNLLGLGIMFGAVAGFAILAYQDSQRPARACDSQKPVTAKWANGSGYQFVTTACDFEANAGKLVAVK